MDIEKLATSAVEESISLTDELSPFINSGDKEPSWDGNIYIYADKQKRKKDIKKVPVQIKGEIRKKLPPKKEPKFTVSLDDLKNWLNDGGIVLFVVLMNESGEEKIIYYNCLTPIKIRTYLGGSQRKKTKSIPLNRFPEDNNQKVSKLLNFYDHMKKQTSFANATLFSLEELKKKGVLEKVSLTVTTYSITNSEYDVETAFLQNEAYLYATIKGSTVPLPILEVPLDLHIAHDNFGSIKVGDKEFYQSYRIVRSIESTDLIIGKSLTLKIVSPNKKVTWNYKPARMLSDLIKDTEFLITALEYHEININGARVPFGEIEKDKFDRYKKSLAYYRDVKKMLDIMGVKRELDCRSLSEQDEKNIKNFVNAVIYGNPIVFPESKENLVYGPFKIGNLLLFIWADKTDSGSYNIQSYFNNHGMAVFDDRDELKKASVSNNALRNVEKAGLFRWSKYRLSEDHR